MDKQHNYSDVMAQGRKLASLVFLTVVILAVLAVCGCYVQPKPRVEMKVKSYGDPDLDYSPLKRFAAVRVNEDSPLLEKELISLLKRELVAEGYIYDDENPDILVVMNFYTGSYDYYEPPRTIRIPLYVGGETKRTTGWVGGKYVTLKEKSDGRFETAEIEVSSGGIRTEYYRTIGVLFIDAEHLRKTGEVEPVWRGQVDSFGSNSDILYVAPVLLDELLSEYPIRSREGPSRIRHDFQTYQPPRPKRSP